MLQSTENIFVAEIEPGLYRVARRGGRSAMTGRFIVLKSEPTEVITVDDLDESLCNFEGRPVDDCGCTF